MTEKNNTKVTPKTETKTDTSTGGKKAMKMQDLKPIKMTQEEFGKLDAAGLRAKLCTEPQSRISRERGKAFLVERVEAGRINSITPEVMMNWTYKAVQIEGATVEGQGFTPGRAKKKLTQTAFGKLDAAGKATLIKEFTHKKRAADVIIPDLVTAGMPLSAEDVVYLTCGRIEIEGVTVTAKSNKTSHAVTEGVKFE